MYRLTGKGLNAGAVAIAVRVCVMVFLWSLSGALERKPSTGSRSAGVTEVGAPRAVVAAMVVHRDPATGEFVPEEVEEPGLRALVAAAEAGLTSAVGLIEAPVAVPAGGVRVDLQGRFQSLLVAERSGTRTVTVDCARSPLSPARASEPKKE